MVDNYGKVSSNPHLVWPQDILVDQNKHFVGFTMREVTGQKELFSFYNKPKRLGLSRIELVDMIIGMCSLVDFIHSRKLVICDLKFQNFVIPQKSLDERKMSDIYIVDTDSFQIEKFYSDMQTPDFYPPEYPTNTAVSKGKKFYRKIEGDRYALFVAIFELLFIGKFPYQCASTAYPKGLSSDDSSDFRKLSSFGYFPYFMKPNLTEEKAPANGACAAKWSHLPSYLKEAFISVASKDQGKRYEPNKRLTAHDWLELFIRYRRDLTTGFLKDKYPDYNVAFPTTPIDYKVVETVNEKAIRKMSFSKAIEAAYASVGLSGSINPQKVENIKTELKSKGVYEDSEVKIVVVFNVGIMMEIKIFKK